MKCNGRSIALAALAAFVAAVPSGATQLAQLRPEMRSYEPYAGFTDGTVAPRPPMRRGVGPNRPEVVMPAPVRPVILSGPPRAYTAQWYAYCADRYMSFEPRTGLYTTNSGRQRMCR